MYNKGDYESINGYFFSIDWDDKFKNLNANDNKRYSPWMNSEIKASLRQKFSAWEAFRRSGWKVQKRILYMKAKKEAARLVKDGVKNFERKIASRAKQNPKQFYKYVNIKTGNGSGETIKGLKEENGHVLTDPKGKELPQPYGLTRLKSGRSFIYYYYYYYILNKIKQINSAP
ncbi:hypothetical protein BpHYR1_026126 [Brachionus plicatilis]|uniref:RNA-directed DNA polymerase from mobile element jockey-like n=1 Tax=Brachionus plicatilis TaxID=10195 RepID=A0A3M7T7Q0_BRAPC|nr:hypothetical protein BpHYR1_026126 [Brachionus plicatilis]